MALDGIITGMIAEEFGAKVRTVRDARRMSREDLARLSGVAVVTLGRLEGKNPPNPRRNTVIDLAKAFGWDVDETLRALQHEPLTGAERAELNRMDNSREQLDRLLDELPASVVYGFLVLARSIANPQALPQVDDDTKDNPERRGAQIQDVTPGSGDVLGAQRQIRRRPQGSDT